MVIVKQHLGWIGLLLGCWVAFLPAQETLVLPHFTESADLWQTQLALVNPGAESLSVSVQAYDENGADLGSTSLNLAAGEGRDQAVVDLFANLTSGKGWLRLTPSGAGLSGLMRFQHRVGGGTASLPLFTETGSGWVLPLLTNDVSFVSGLALVNLGDEARNLTLTLTDYEGGTPRSVSRTVSPHGKLVAMARDLFGENVPTKSSLSIRADGEIAAFALSFSPTVDQIVAVPGRVTNLPTLDNSLDRDIAQWVSEGSLPGLAAAVIVDGAVVWQRGFGLAEIDGQRPVTAETPFLLASISKALTAAAVVKAVEQGALTVEDSVGTHLPFALDNPLVSGETIRLSHLLTHTSGIIDNETVTEQSYTYGSDSPISLGAFLQDYLVAGGRWYDADNNFLAGAPGSESDYSNIASALAGYVVERAVDTDFAQFFQQQFFEPLSMNHSGWFLRDVIDDQPAIPYRVSRAGRFESIGHYGFPDYPNGQCRASVADLAVFLAMVMNGGTYQGTRVLSSASVAEMLAARPVPVGEGTVSQGWMWFSMREYGRHLVGHDGGEEGADTFMFFDPEAKIGVITLVNGDGDGLDQDVLDRIRQRLFDYGAARKRGY